MGRKMLKEGGPCGSLGDGKSSIVGTPIRKAPVSVRFWVRQASPIASGKSSIYMLENYPITWMRFGSFGKYPAGVVMQYVDVRRQDLEIAKFLLEQAAREG